ncbi:hypothetical protein [Ornithinimicrobium sp. W1665]|uniref:hypothetical protein n=1 Tax=Ornithinimicrobium sp. W1665 TaxID=3416666 RepID=UPI003D6B1B71
MHAQWDNQFVHPVREVLTAPGDEHRSIPAVAKAVMHRYHHAFDRVIYTESHDEVANGKARITSEVQGENPSGWDAQKMATLGAALVLTAPGMPMLFQGRSSSRTSGSATPCRWTGSGPGPSGTSPSSSATWCGCAATSTARRPG